MSASEISKAYLKLVKKYHPDSNQDKPENIRRELEEKLKMINEAYETIKRGR